MVLVAVVCVTATVVPGFATAMLPESLGKRMRLTLMVGLALAWSVPTVTSSLVWSWLFQPWYGW